MSAYRKRGARKEIRPPSPAPPPEILRLDIVEFGGRAQGLIERIRETGEEIVVMARGRPVARLTPFQRAPEEPEDRITWDVEGIAP